MIYVSANGVAEARARLAETDARCAEILRAAALPEGVSPHIPVAPARGPVVMEAPVEMVMTDKGPVELRTAVRGHDRVRVRIGDAFDVMCDQARRAHAASKKNSPFIEPFSLGQINVGRAYARLVERVDASGVCCSSAEGMPMSGSVGGKLTVSEAVARDIDWLRSFHRRIGDGLAKDVRRPSKGGIRHAITVRDLVDRVCLAEQSIGEVMRACGWGENSHIKRVLRGHLCLALDRMNGFDLVKPTLDPNMEG